jgi:hypothetical protein
MTANEFRRAALALPDALESVHMGHPDFRVAGRIFATLSRGEVHGVVMLTPAQQRAFIEQDPAAFAPVKGAWGRRGCTQVDLAAARPHVLRDALALAFGNRAQPAQRKPRKAKKP